MEVPASSDAEVGGMSQSEDERGSFFSELHENIDVITEALREDEETEVLELKWRKLYPVRRDLTQQAMNWMSTQNLLKCI